MCTTSLRDYYHVSILCITFCVCRVDLFTQAATAQDAVSAADRFESLLRGFLQEREDLRSGEATIEGTRTSKTVGSSDFTGQIRGLYAFDSETDSLRYDNEETQNIEIINPTSNGKNTPAGPTLFPVRLCYARNPEYSASWTREGVSTRSNIEIRNPHDSMGGLVAVNHHLFDIKAIGIADIRSFRNGTAAPIIAKRLLAQQIVETTLQNDEAVVRCKHGDWETTIQFETDGGIRPTMYRMASEAGEYVSETEWQRVADSYVPVVARIRFEDKKRQSVVEYLLSLTWRSVNSAVDKSVFEYTSFKDIPTELLIEVFDNRGAVVKHVGHWAGDGTLRAPKMEIMPARSVESLIDHGVEPNRWRFVIVANLVVLGVVIALASRRRTKKETPHP